MVWPCNYPISWLIIKLPWGFSRSFRLISWTRVLRGWADHSEQADLAGRCKHACVASSASSPGNYPIRWLSPAHWTHPPLLRHIQPSMAIMATVLANNVRGSRVASHRGRIMDISCVYGHLPRNYGALQYILLPPTLWPGKIMRDSNSQVLNWSPPI